MHEVLVNRLGGLSLPRKSVVRLTDRPDMTLDVYPGRKTTKQQQQLYAKQVTCINRQNDNHIACLNYKCIRLHAHIAFECTCHHVHSKAICECKQMCLKAFYAAKGLKYYSQIERLSSV